MAKSKTKEYNVQRKFSYIVTAIVMADSIEEALEKGQALDDERFIEVLGDLLDGDSWTTGVYESNL